MTPVLPIIDADDTDELFAATVPRRLVHRRAVSEVFATGWQRSDEHVHLIGAQWPQAHRFYAQSHGKHDSLLLAETVRQAAFVVAHRGYQVPFGYQFIMWDLAFDCLAEGLEAHYGPTEVQVKATCHDLRYRAGRVTGMRMTFDIYRDAQPIATGTASFDLASPVAYSRMRTHAAEQHTVEAPSGGAVAAVPLRPETVHREHSYDVVLAADGGEGWLLHLNRSHPVLFDHPVDHVPGMVLIEAMRQAANAQAGPRPSTVIGLRTNFENYIEFNAPCRVHAELLAEKLPSGEHSTSALTVSVRVEQNGIVAARGIVLVEPHAVLTSLECAVSA